MVYFSGGEDAEGAYIADVAAAASPWTASLRHVHTLDTGNLPLATRESPQDVPQDLTQNRLVLGNIIINGNFVLSILVYYNFIEEMLSPDHP